MEFVQAYLYVGTELIRLDGYLVNRQGEVMGTLWNSHWTEPRILTPQPNQKGYHRVRVNVKGISKMVALHRIVASTFIPREEGKPEVNHKDKNRGNNHCDNLEWVDRKTNISHANVGAKRKLNDEQVRYIRTHYIPRDKEFGLEAMAKKFNIGKRTAMAVISGETYKEVLPHGEMEGEG